LDAHLAQDERCVRAVFDKGHVVAIITHSGVRARAVDGEPPVSVISGLVLDLAALVALVTIECAHKELEGVQIGLELSIVACDVEEVDMADVRAKWHLGRDPWRSPQRCLVLSGRPEGQVVSDETLCSKVAVELSGHC